jgi:hypothetical protein
MTRLEVTTPRDTDAWSREARRVRERATRLGLALDDEDLALRDVHDLQALHASLHGPRTGPAGTCRIMLQGLQAWVRAWATGAAAAIARRS